MCLTGFDLPIAIEKKSMKTVFHRNSLLLLFCLVLSGKQGLSFTGIPLRQNNVQLLATAEGSTTLRTETYDVVQVDLADGRDYPIYIGSQYSGTGKDLTLMSKHVCCFLVHLT